MRTRSTYIRPPRRSPAALIVVGFILAVELAAVSWLLAHIWWSWLG